MFLSKDFFGYLTIILTVFGTILYCRLVIQNKIKPHIFTWIIWAVIGAVAGAARSAGDAGPGAWGAWASAGACVTITMLAYYKGEKNIKRSDLIVFIAALSAIPIWLITHNPLLAVIIVTCIDTAGYYPTARKSWIKPFEEPIFNYVIANSIHILSLLANVTHSLTTILMPAVLLVVNTALITMILWRRKATAPAQ